MSLPADPVQRANAIVAEARRLGLPADEYVAALRHAEQEVDSGRTATPSLADLRSMPFADFRAFADENPGAVEAALRRRADHQEAGTVRAAQQRRIAAEREARERAFATDPEAAILEHDRRRLRQIAHQLSPSERTKRAAILGLNPNTLA